MTDADLCLAMFMIWLAVAFGWPVWWFFRGRA